MRQSEASPSPAANVSERLENFMAVPYSRYVPYWILPELQRRRRFGANAGQMRPRSGGRCSGPIQCRSGQSVSLMRNATLTVTPRRSADLTGLDGLVPLHLGAGQLLDVSREGDRTQKGTIAAHVEHQRHEPARV